MPEQKKVIHFKLLTALNPEDSNEVRTYECSECDDVVFNINVHAQTAHQTIYFDVDQDEKARTHEPPFHPCGVSGCTFAPHEDGPHSWETV